jgi:folate-binding protein YgfZ
MHNFVAELPGLNILEISGEDAGDFIQAQFTNDISQLSDQNSQYSAWCNSRGRIIANFFISRVHDAYLLTLPGEMIDMVYQRLSMYILRSRVSLTDKSKIYRCIGLCELDAIERLSESSEGSNSNKAFVLVDMPVDKGKRFILIDMKEDRSSLHEFFDSTILIGDEKLWQKFDILAGLPWITIKTSEKLLPQEVSLDQLGGLSYNKGCYPGQEVIARIHYRSKLNNKLYCGIAGLAEKAIQPGASIYNDSHDRKSGIVINTAVLPDNKQLLLAVMDMESVDNNKKYFLEDNLAVPMDFVTPGSLSESVLNDIRQD